MILFFLFLFLEKSFSKGCLNDEGTFQINIKVYLDQNAMHAITNYNHSIRPHKETKKYDHSHEEFEDAHVKDYIGSIFNEINRVIKGTNVQFRADFTHLQDPQFKHLHEQYCSYFKDIINITEHFLSDFENAHESGESKLLIIDCRDNNPFAPKSSHIASKNNCGKVLGVLMTDPAIMKNTIVEGLYRIFTTKSLSSVDDISGAIQTDLCSYIHECNRNFNNAGFFVKDLGLLTHSQLGDHSNSGIGYKITSQYIKNEDPVDDSIRINTNTHHRETEYRRDIYRGNMIPYFDNI